MEGNDDRHGALTSEHTYNAANEPLSQEMERRARVLHRMRRRRTQRMREVSEPYRSSRSYHPTPLSSSEVNADQGSDRSNLRPRTDQNEAEPGSSIRTRRLSIEQLSEDLRRAEQSLLRIRQQGYGVSHPDPSRGQSTDRNRIRQRLSTVNNEAAQEYFGEAEVNRQRAKRRKLDGDTFSSKFRGFSYGYRGQAVAGPLNMEIVRCDGGVHPNARGPLEEYSARNILRNDKTVYCTKVSKCNIILRHQGETPFALKKIIIKAPERGFTAPIQEGLIFVAMDVKDLVKQTSAYEVRESSPSIDSELDSDENDILAYESRRMQTIRVGNPPTAVDRPPSRRTDPGAPRIVPPPISNAHRSPFVTDLRIDSLNTVNDADPLLGAPSPPPFDVTTHCDTPSSDEEDESNESTLADRRLRNLLTPGSSDSEDLSRPVPGQRRIRQRSRRRSLPSRIEITRPTEQEAGETQMAESEKRYSRVLAPHARFFIEPERSTVTVRFSPEV